MLTVEKAKSFGFTKFKKVDEGTIVVFGSEEHQPMAMENGKGVQAQLQKAGLKRAKKAPALPKESKEKKAYSSRSTVAPIKDVSDALGKPPLYFDTFDEYREIVWKEFSEEQGTAAQEVLDQEHPKCRYRLEEERLVLIIPRVTEDGELPYNQIRIPYVKNIDVGLNDNGTLDWLDEQGGEFTGNTAGVSKKDLKEAFETIYRALWGE
jgi:hypothetical protein